MVFITIQDLVSSQCLLICNLRTLTIIFPYVLYHLQNIIFENSNLFCIFSTIYQFLQRCPITNPYKRDILAMGGFTVRTACKMFFLSQSNQSSHSIIIIFNHTNIPFFIKNKFFSHTIILPAVSPPSTPSSSITHTYPLSQVYFLLHFLFRKEQDSKR